MAMNSACFLLGALFGAVAVIVAAVLYADRRPRCRGHPQRIIPRARSNHCEREVRL